MEFQIIDFHSQDILYNDFKDDYETNEFLENSIETLQETLTCCDNESEDRIKYSNNKKIHKWLKWAIGFYTKNFKKYFVTVFGKKMNGESISLNIDDFKPYFFVKIPDKWKKNDNNYQKFLDYIIMNMWFNHYYQMPKKLSSDNPDSETGFIGNDEDKQCESRWEVFYDYIKHNNLKSLLYKFIGVVNFKIIKRKILEGFTNNKKFNFVQIKFENMKAFYACRRIFQQYKIINHITKESLCEPKPLTI